MLTIILACILLIPRELPPKVDFVSAFNAGYDARWRDGKPQSANPHAQNTEARKWWDDGFTWKGWMPDWREFMPDKSATELAINVCHAVSMSVVLAVFFTLLSGAALEYPAVL